MPPPAQSYQYTDRDSIESLLSAEGLTLSLDDDRDGEEATKESARVAMAVGFATAKVDLFCQPSYDPSQLANSWSVWNWATILAAWWLRNRRGNPGPASLKEMKDEVMQELEMVRAGQMQVDSIGRRSTMAPAWSNVRVDPRYRLHQSRIQRPISDRTNRPYPAPLDRQSEWLDSER